MRQLPHRDDQRVSRRGVRVLAIRWSGRVPFLVCGMRPPDSTRARSGGRGDRRGLCGSAASVSRFSPARMLLTQSRQVRPRRRIYPGHASPVPLQLRTPETGGACAGSRSLRQRLGSSPWRVSRAAFLCLVLVGRRAHIPAMDSFQHRRTIAAGDATTPRPLAAVPVGRPAPPAPADPSA
jgi:hypothetical protein